MSSVRKRFLGLLRSFYRDWARWFWCYLVYMQCFIFWTSNLPNQIEYEPVLWDSRAYKPHGFGWTLLNPLTGTFFLDLTFNFIIYISCITLNISFYEYKIIFSKSNRWPDWFYKLCLFSIYSLLMDDEEGLARLPRMRSYNNIFLLKKIDKH